MKRDNTPISRSTQTALKAFGTLIKNSRSIHKMSQAELAERLNVSRLTVISIEKGNAKVSIGTFFEAATILEIPLLLSENNLFAKAKTFTHINSLLPKRIRKQSEDLNDEF